MPASVLVTDGQERSALAVVRSLGRAGYEVAVASPVRRPLAGASRHAAGVGRTPDPLADPGGYCDAVGEIVRSGSVDVLLPVTEASLSALLPERERFGDVTIPFPAHDRFRAITDKALVAEAARDVGIPVPRQEILQGPDEAAYGPPREIGFPLVLKPARSVAEAAGVRARVGVRHVESEEAYRQAVGDLPPQAFPVLVQEWIEGTGAGVFLLLRDGEVLARFAHRRIREKPPSGGVSVCRESVAADPGLVDASRKLLAHFGWHGVAMVEFRVEDGTGRPFIMEVNPRFWGSLQLAVDAGVDFPRLLVESALGREVEPVDDYEIGIRTRWWWGEVDHVVARVKETFGSGGAMPALRELWSGGGDLVSGWGGASRSEVWSQSDVGPFLRESLDWFRGR